MTAPVLLDAQGKPLSMPRPRASLEIADTAYRGASFRARELASWLPPWMSADAELLPEQPALVARSRDLGRNHGIASGAFQTLVDNVVGTGLRLSAKPDYRALGRTKEWADAWAKNVEGLWRGWAGSVDCDVARQLTFNSQCAQAFRTAMMSGDAVALVLWQPERGGRFATTIQLVDPDRLGNPQMTPATPTLRGGIETDPYGAPLAYWLRRAHPFDVGGFGTVASAEWDRVPAATPWGRRRVIHLHDKERTGQSRGKPILAPVMSTFRSFDHYERSELQAAVVNAMIAAFIETPMDSADIAELLSGEAGPTYLKQRDEWQAQLKSGSIIPMLPGDRMAAFTPSRPNAAYGDYTTNILRHIGVALGIPLELLMKDFSKTNYSSARAALLEAWRFFLGRRTWLTTYFADPVYVAWLEEAVGRGLVEAPTFYEDQAAWCRCAWIGAGRGWVDPLKEAQASRARIDGRISTLERECAEQGLDWEEVLEQQAREQAMMAELGLTMPAPAIPPVDTPQTDRGRADQGQPDSGNA